MNIPLKDINDIVTPDMENVKLSEKIGYPAIFKYQLIKMINGIGSALGIGVLLIVFVLIFYLIILPLIHVLR